MVAGFNLVVVAGFSLVAVAMFCVVVVHAGYHSDQSQLVGPEVFCYCEAQISGSHTSLYLTLSLWLIWKFLA